MALRGFPKWVPRFNTNVATSAADSVQTGWLVDDAPVKTRGRTTALAATVALASALAFVPQPPAGTAAVPAAQADDGGLVRHSRLLYDQFAGPVLPPVVAAATATGVQADDGGLIRHSKLLYDQFAGPVLPPAASAAVQTFVGAAEAPTRVRRRAPALETVYALPPTVAQPWVDVPAAPVKVRRIAQAQEAVIPLRPADVVVAAAQTWVDVPEAPAKFRRRGQALELVISLPPVVAQPYVGTADDPVRIRRRAQTQEAITPFPPIAAAVTAQTLASTHSGLIIRQQLVFSDDIVGPSVQAAAAAPGVGIGAFIQGQSDVVVRKRWRQTLLSSFVLAIPEDGTATPDTLATTHSGLIIKTRLVFQDEIVGPLPPLQAPVGVGAGTFIQGQFDVVARKPWRRTPLSAFVFAIPIPDDIGPSADTDQPKVRKKRVLPQEVISPPQNVGAQTPVVIVTTGTAAFDSPTVIHSRGLYDPYTGPVGPVVVAAGTPTTSSFFLDADKASVRRRSKPLQEIAFPVAGAPAQQGTPTASAFLFDADKPLLRRRLTASWENVAVFPQKVDIHLATDTSQPQVRKTRLRDSEAFAAPIFQLFGTTTPSEYGWQTPYQLPPTKRAFKPVDALAAKPDQEPPPFVGVPVPSFLFDWSSNGRGYKINKVAVTTNDGFTWDPQDPSTLTGTTEPGPVVTPPGAGGLPVTRKSGPRRGVWIEYSKGKKKWREKVAILPPVEAPQEIKDATNVPAPESLKEATRTLSDLKAYTPPAAQPVEPQVKTQAEIDEEDMMIIAIIESLD